MMFNERAHNLHPQMNGLKLLQMTFRLFPFDHQMASIEMARASDCHFTAILSDMTLNLLSLHSLSTESALHHVLWTVIPNVVIHPVPSHHVF